MATTLDKVRYLVNKHPEVRYCLDNHVGVNIADFYNGENKRVIISTDPNLWRWHALGILMRDPKMSLREIDVHYALDVFLGNVEEDRSLSSIKADVLVIHDGRLKMKHSQKDVILAQLWESSPYIIYDWSGDQASFQARSQLDSSLYERRIDSGTNNPVPVKLPRPDISCDLF